VSGAGHQVVSLNHDYRHPPCRDVGLPPETTQSRRAAEAALGRPTTGRLMQLACSLVHPAQSGERRNERCA